MTQQLKYQHLYPTDIEYEPPSSDFKKPSDSEIQDYASYLGFGEHKDLVWIAEAALCAPLPKGWAEYTDQKGNVRCQPSSPWSGCPACMPALASSGWSLRCPPNRQPPTQPLDASGEAGILPQSQ